MAEITFTLDQQKAHDALRHLSITANAGSGKTRVLVSRYCDIVEYDGIRPAEMAAITFTEKAASELRTRIAEELEKRLGDESHKANWEKLKKAREGFTSAMVSTIHGFCSQLLREYPIETDTPPSFRVISGYERRVIEKEVVEEAIETALSGPSEDPQQITESYRTARRISRELLEEIVQMMVNNREPITFSLTNGVLALGKSETLELWDTTIRQAVESTLRTPEVLSKFQDLISFMRNPGEAQQLLQALRDAQTPDEILRQFNALKILPLTKDGTPRRTGIFRLPREEVAMLNPLAEPIQRAAERAKPLLEIVPNPALHQELLDDTRVILDIFFAAIHLYEQRKSHQNALDFEDLQLRLLFALQQPDPSRALLSRFKAIMVDEFQDTNALQYAIVHRLLSRLQSLGRICIVGDKKQSIYGFRNAEVEVFDHADHDITERNREEQRVGQPLEYRKKEIPETSQEESLGIIRLDASFRLLPSNCAYVNLACSPVMTPEGLFNFGVPYEPLVCARRSTGAGGVEVILARDNNDNDSNNNDDEGESSGTHEAEQTIAEQKIGDPNEAEATEPTVSEAELIARRILQLVVTGEEQVVWESPAAGEPEQPRPARFGDIAILCRKRNSFQELEDAFRAYGIPFLNFGSSRFYSSQEIYDIVNYLSVLLNVNDDVALLGLLRSPYFGVSDAELYRIGTSRSGRSLWERAAQRAKQEGAHEAVRRAIQAIEEDRAMAGRIPLSLLMRRVLERTGWRGAVIGTERGEQAMANIDKLMENARTFESRGFTNLYDFVEQIREQIQGDEVESEAPINTGRDAVLLMTMHASKGLEFPVVFLPSLHSPPRRANTTLFDRDLGFGWNWKFNHDDQKPAIASLMKLRATERERAEEARLFYVATTRARDLLILSGNVKTTKRGTTKHGTTMLDWGLAPLGDFPAENGTVEVPSKLWFLSEDGRTKTEKDWNQQVKVWYQLPEQPRHETEAGPAQIFRSELVNIGELPARAEGDIYSATQFLVYSQCPTKYYLKYRLGIPEDLTAAYDPEFDPNTRDSEDGTTFARLFRRAALRVDEMLAEMSDASEEEPSNAHAAGDEFLQAIYGQQIDSIAAMVETEPAATAPQAEADTRDAVERVADDVLLTEPLPTDQAERMRQRLIGTFRRILNSPQAQQAIAPAGSTSYVEHELRIPFENDFVLGVMDRLIVEADKAIAVLHYKTRKVAANALKSTADEYLPQLRLYAYLVSLLRPEQRTFRCVILFTEHPDAPQEFTFSRFDMHRAEDELRSAFRDIHDLSYTSRSRLPLQAPHCPHCPYWIEKACLLGRGNQANG